MKINIGKAIIFFEEFGKKIFLLLLMCLCLFSFSLKGQPLPNSNFKEDQQLAINVYETLKKAIGDKRKNWPNLVLLGIENRVASFVPLENVIYLDQKAVRVCRLFKERAGDALAFIIGHELNHFYEQHDWKEVGFADTFIISKEKFLAFRNYERKADIYGAFIAQQAGYRTISLVPNLLTYIYENYQLDPAENNEYPSLQERKSLAKDACKVASELVDAYQTANYAMILGKYENAFQLYDFVGKNIQFKELYNNIGLSNLLPYYYQDSKNQLAYPFLLDPYIPLLRSDQIRPPTTLLKTAITAFEKVNIEYESNYFPALLHLLIAYDWEGNKQKTEELINSFNPNIISATEHSILQLTIGNYYVQNNQPSEALQIYAILLRNKNEFVKALAAKNINYLTKGINAKELPTKTPEQRIEKDIDNIPSLPFYRNFNRKIPINQYTNLEVTEQPNSYLTRLDKLKIQRVYSPLITTKQGGRIGSSVSAIKAMYPDIRVKQVGFATGFYLVHFEKGLIFKCNDKEVEEWVLFCL